MKRSGGESQKEEVCRLDTYLGLVRRLITSLNEAESDYMFTGAIAASYYGIPRTTMDVDLIVYVTQQHATNLDHALEDAKIKIDQNRIREALESGYNIATLEDTLTPYTVDLILVREPLQKRAATISGLPTYIQTPEHLILSKLRMIKATVNRGKAAKDEEDIKSILKYTQVDLNQVKKTAKKENTHTILKTIIG